MTQTAKALWLLARLPLYAIVGWALGFGWFWTQLPNVAEQTPTTEVADAIVVLTGDKGRIEAGIDLLAAGQASRMLISGVHPDVRAEALYGLSGEAERLLECCIDLGREALNTVGNARETAAWAEARDFKTLLVITSDYHTPRSMVLLRRAMPDRTLIPVPVATEVKLEPLVTEYNKYLFTLVRIGGGL